LELKAVATSVVAKTDVIVVIHPLALHDTETAYFKRTLSKVHAKHPSLHYFFVYPKRTCLSQNDVGYFFIQFEKFNVRLIPQEMFVGVRYYFLDSMSLDDMIFELLQTSLFDFTNDLPYTTQIVPFGNYYAWYTSTIPSTSTFFHPDLPLALE
jgi:hypothetical protein